MRYVGLFNVLEDGNLLTLCDCACVHVFLLVCVCLHVILSQNIQSTNWQSMRFKPPPPNSPIGWRVEFRPMEVGTAPSI